MVSQPFHVIFHKPHRIQVLLQGFDANAADLRANVDVLVHQIHLLVLFDVYSTLVRGKRLWVKDGQAFLLVAGEVFQILLRGAASRRCLGPFACQQQLLHLDLGQPHAKDGVVHKIQHVRAATRKPRQKKDHISRLAKPCKCRAGLLHVVDEPADGHQVLLHRGLPNAGQVLGQLVLAFQVQLLCLLCLEHACTEDLAVWKQMLNQGKGHGIQRVPRHGFLGLESWWAGPAKCWGYLLPRSCGSTAVAQ